MGNRRTKIKMWAGICLLCILCGIYLKNVYGETPENENYVRYEMIQNEPDGEEGYYLKTPQVKLVHRDASYVTRAELGYEDGSKMNMELNAEGEERELTEWREGKHILTIWMENEQGEVLEETKAEYIYWVDTKPIQIEMQAENGFSAWHNSPQNVTVYAKERGSGIAYVRCIVNGQVVKEEKKDGITFAVSENSIGGNGVKIEVEAKDTAGHISRATEVLYIDGKPPVFTIQGVKDGTAQNRDVSLKFGAADDNVLHRKSLRITLTGTDGKEKVVLDKWNGTVTLAEEGAYLLMAVLEDAAGNRTEQKLCFTIDKTKPEILKISELNGVYMQKFIADFQVADIVRECSDYKCELALDGKPYDLKKVLQTEGKHQLYVKVTDVAGNLAEADAVFYIDRTRPEIRIMGVEDHAEYEGEAAWTVQLANRGDRIVGIWLNGEKCVWKDQYRVKEPGTYRMLVRAVDAAGNRSVKEVQFRVKVAPKVVSDVEMKWDKKFKIGFQSGKEAGNMYGTTEKGNRAAILMVVLVACAVIISAWLWHKKSSHKREDAG